MARADDAARAVPAVRAGRPRGDGARSRGSLPLPRPSRLRLLGAAAGRRKLDGMREKVALREVAARVLPPEIAERGKQPYRAPEIAPFFAPDAPDWVEDALSPSALARNRALGRERASPACAAVPCRPRDRHAGGDGARRHPLDAALAPRVRRSGRRRLPARDRRAAGPHRSHHRKHRPRRLSHDGGRRGRPAATCGRTSRRTSSTCTPASSSRTTTTSSRSAIVDSLGFVELVEEVQSRYGIDGRGRRDHGGELRLDRCHRPLRRAKANRGLSGRTLGEDLRAAAARDPDRTAVVGARAARCPTASSTGWRTVSRPASRRSGVERGDRVARRAPERRRGGDRDLRRPPRRRGVLAAEPDDQATTSSPTCSPTRARRRSICDAARARAVVDEARVVAGDGPDRHATSRRSPDAAPPPVALSVDLAALIYTSGSTGDPKGVTLTHGNMTFAADSIIEYLRMDESDRVLCVLPLSFDYGLYQLLMSDPCRRNARAGARLRLPGTRACSCSRTSGSPGFPACRRSSTCCCRCAGWPSASCPTCASSRTRARLCRRRRSPRFAARSRTRGSTRCTG